MNTYACLVDCGDCGIGIGGGLVFLGGGVKTKTPPGRDVRIKGNRPKTEERGKKKYYLKAKKENSTEKTQIYKVRNREQILRIRSAIAPVGWFR